jgi:predicted esterase YcpF (UPF0227 family)
MLKLLNDDQDFNEWKNTNSSTYLVHIFKMLDSANKDESQVGFYDKNSKRITTFVVNETLNTVNMNPDSEPFKEDDTPIEELKLDNVGMTIDSTMKKIDELMKEKYSSHPADKRFFLLQKTKDGTIWNFTVVTKTFHVLNVKIDAKEGNILSQKINSIFEFKSK